MTKDEALKLALPIIERERFIQDASYGRNYNAHRSEEARKAHEAIKEALAQPEQEPVEIDWNAVHEKLELVWYRELSADEGLEEIQDLIDTTPPQGVEE